MVAYSTDDVPGNTNMTRHPERQHKSLLGGARIACKEAPAPRDEASTSTRPQGNEMLNTKMLLDDGVGFTGLNNLGNTCFMSCVLQALANNKELREYFLSKTFVTDINIENPLGTGGRLAKAFYATLHHLWSGEHKSYAPTKLKSIVASRAPQFVGFMQHDAQEFMAFFLDALHEDLNKVRVKPVFEVPQLENNPEELIANKSWNLHKSRNDSFIVDKFHGMYKSKLTCPDCNKESTTFDPFLFLPVPIPKPKKWITVTVFRQTTGHILNVSIPEEGAIASDILNHVGTKYSLPIGNLAIFEVEAGNIKEKFSANSLLPSLSSTPSIVVCELLEDAANHILVLQRLKIQNTANACAECGKSSTEASVKILRCAKCWQVGYCSQECQRMHWRKHKSKCRPPFIGCPFMVSLGLETKYAELSQHLQKLASFSVDVFHCSQEDQAGFRETSAYQASYNQRLPFSIFARYDDSPKNGVLLKNESPKNVGLQGVSQLIVEWSSDVTVSEINTKQSVGPHNPTVEDCIQLFTEPEVLAAEEAWYCPCCKKHTQATKEISLWQLPDVLIIQLKRFSFRNRIWRDKIDRLVQFPISGLDTSPFCVNNQANDPIYDLFAVVNHHGGLFGGHYTSYVRLSEENAEPGWRLCDDTRVTAVRPNDQLVTSSSYVMFYQKRRKPTSMGGSGDDQWNNSPVKQDLPQESHYLRTEEKETCAMEEPSPLTQRPITVGVENEIKDNLVKSLTATKLSGDAKDVPLKPSQDIPPQKDCSAEVVDGEQPQSEPEMDSIVSVSESLHYTDMDAID